MIILGWLMIALFFVAEIEGMHYEVAALLEELDERYGSMATPFETAAGAA